MVLLRPPLDLSVPRLFAHCPHGRPLRSRRQVGPPGLALPCVSRAPRQGLGIRRLLSRWELEGPDLPRQPPTLADSRMLEDPLPNGALSRGPGSPGGPGTPPGTLPGTRQTHGHRLDRGRWNRAWRPGVDSVSGPRREGREVTRAGRGPSASSFPPPAEFTAGPSQCPLGQGGATAGRGERGLGGRGRQGPEDTEGSEVGSEEPRPLASGRSPRTSLPERNSRRDVLLRANWKRKPLEEQRGGRGQAERGLLHPKCTELFGFKIMYMHYFAKKRKSESNTRSP